MATKDFLFMAQVDPAQPMTTAPLGGARIGTVMFVGFDWRRT